MNRAFLSLYFFIVTSVVLIGWGLNQFWENIAPEQKPTPEIVALLQLIEQDLLTAQAENNYQQQAQHISRMLRVSLELLSLDDVAQSAALDELHAGKILASHSKHNIIWYKRLANTNHVIMLSLPVNDDSASPLYRLLLIIFYLAIAVAIYVWVWPLSRDSKKLEMQTRSLGQDGVPHTLKISPTSTLYPLAQAFNHMAQRLRELITSHREMTNAVSHELRTPLARMKFALALIDEVKLDEKNRRQLRSVEQDVAEMEALISALLMYAGFEQKTQTLQQTPGHMHDLLAEIQQRFNRHNQRHLQLHIIDHSDGQVFSCEWKLMETVLQNLINNAARYATHSIRVELSQTVTHYGIAVEDDGPGIPADKREKVFESFVRLYSENSHEALATNTSTGGFGLGLAIVKRIMQWHGGTAEFVEPEQFGGARVIIHWPQSSSSNGR
jgi:two-component system OmpR family sensor kinase